MTWSPVCWASPGGVTVAQVFPPLTVRAMPCGPPLPWVQAQAAAAPAGQTWRRVCPPTAGDELAAAAGETAAAAEPSTLRSATADTGLGAAHAATATSAPPTSTETNSGWRTGMTGMPPPLSQSDLQDAGLRDPVAVNCGDLPWGLASALAARGAALEQDRRRGRGDHQDAAAPGQRDPGAVPRGERHQVGADAVDDGGGGLVPGEPAQPGRHGGDGHEAAADVGQEQ